MKWLLTFTYFVDVLTVVLLNFVLFIICSFLYLLDVYAPVTWAYMSPTWIDNKKKYSKKGKKGKNKKKLLKKKQQKQLGHVEHVKLLWKTEIELLQGLYWLWSTSSILIQRICNNWAT